MKPYYHQLCHHRPHRSGISQLGRVRPPRVDNSIRVVDSVSRRTVVRLSKWLDPPIGQITRLTRLVSLPMTHSHRFRHAQPRLHEHLGIWREIVARISKGKHDYRQIGMTDHSHSWPYECRSTNALTRRFLPGREEVELTKYSPIAFVS